MTLLLYVFLFLCLGGCFFVLLPILLSSSDIFSILLGITLFLLLIASIVYQLWENHNAK